METKQRTTKWRINKIIVHTISDEFALIISYKFSLVKLRKRKVLHTAIYII